jgi:hypothetical protein
MSFLEQIAFSSKLYTHLSLEVYESEHYRLFITGEGAWDVCIKLSTLLNEIRPSTSCLVNFGVCGSIDSQFKTKEIFSIRTSYGHLEHPLFHSYHAESEKEQSIKNADCLSVLDRVNSPEQKKQLRCMAPLIDRELYSMAKVAGLFNIPWSAYKIVSDSIEEVANCQQIKSRAEDYSIALFEFFKDLNPEVQETASELSDLDQAIHTLQAHFYFTFNHLNQVKQLFKKIQKAKPDFLLIPFAKEMLEEKKNKQLSKKQLTRCLIDKLQTELNPWMQNWKNKFQQLTHPYQTESIHIENTENSARPRLKFSFSVSSTVEMKKNISLIEQFPFDHYQSLYEEGFDD